jgi:hypothetical protein
MITKAKRTFRNPLFGRYPGAERTFRKPRSGMTNFLNGRATVATASAARRRRNAAPDRQSRGRPRRTSPAARAWSPRPVLAGGMSLPMGRGRLR